MLLIANIKNSMSVQQIALKVSKNLITDEKQIYLVKEEDKVELDKRKTLAESEVFEGMFVFLYLKD